MEILQEGGRRLHRGPEAARKRQRLQSVRIWRKPGFTPTRRSVEPHRVPPERRMRAGCGRACSASPVTAPRWAAIYRSLSTRGLIACARRRAAPFAAFPGCRVTIRRLERPQKRTRPPITPALVVRVGAAPGIQCGQLHSRVCASGFHQSWRSSRVICAWIDTFRSLSRTAVFSARSSSATLSRRAGSPSKSAFFVGTPASNSEAIWWLILVW